MFHERAALVEQFVFENGLPDDIDESVYNTLARASSNGFTIFQRLETVILRDKCPSAAALSFIPTSLRRVELEFGYNRIHVVNHAALQLFLNMLVARLPFLAHFSLDISETLQRIDLRPLINLEHLESLSLHEAIRPDSGISLGVVDEGFYEALSARGMPNLAALDFSLHDIGPINRPRFLTFPRLNKIKMTGSASSIDNALRALTTLDLRVVTMMLEQATFNDFNSLFWGLQFRWSLRSVKIRVENADFGSINLLESEVLSYLLHLHNLEELDLNVAPVTIHMCNNDVALMTLAWPNIKRLAIVGADSVEQRQTLECLAYFAADCRSLVDLEFCVRADTVIYERPIGNHGLQSLTLNSGPIADVMATARFIDSLFPSLKEVAVYDDAEERIRIKHLIRTFQSVRKSASSATRVTSIEHQ